MSTSYGILTKIHESLPGNPLNNLKPGNKHANISEAILAAFNCDGFETENKSKEREVVYEFNEKIYNELMNEKPKSKKGKSKK